MRDNAQRIFCDIIYFNFEEQNKVHLFCDFQISVLWSGVTRETKIITRPNSRPNLERAEFHCEAVSARNLCLFSKQAKEKKN